MGSAPTEGIGWLEGGGSVEGLKWTDRRDGLFTGEGGRVVLGALHD